MKPSQATMLILSEMTSWKMKNVFTLWLLQKDSVYESLVAGISLLHQTKKEVNVLVILSRYVSSVRF